MTPRQAPAGTAVGAPGLGELPYFTFQDFALATDSAARVNIANGNLLVKGTDAAIAGPGYALRSDRFYNGLSSDAGSMGGGWKASTAAYDVGLENHGTYVIFHGPNGLTARFDRTAPNTFTKPAGLNATLTRIADFGDFAFVLTYNQTGEQLKFSGTGYLTASVDRNGVGEFYNYSGGQMVVVGHDTGRSLSFDWSSGHLASMTDSAGRTTGYTYDSSSRLWKVTTPDGKVTTYTYDSTGRLSTVTVPNAATATTTVTFGYDSSHRVTTVTQKSSSPTWGAKADLVTSFSYTSGQTVVTNPNGNTATYTLDTSGRVTATKDALNRTRTQTWTANSDVATTTDALGSGSIAGNTTTYTYDGSNNVTNAQLPTGAAAAAVYTAGGTCTAPNTGTAYQAKCSTDPSGNTKTHEYDANGNPTKTTNSTAGVTEFERTYDTSARALCGGFAGQLCSAKDGNGNTTTYAYDTHGNMTAVTPPAPLGATTYTYDSLGRVTTVTDGKGDTTEYDYDVRDRITLTTYDNGDELSVTYHANGLEKMTTDSTGLSKTLDYDTQGRLTQQSGPNTGVTQKYAYDPAGNMMSYRDSGGIVTYTYDAANQLTSVKEPGGNCPSSGSPAANSGCTLFTYNANGIETKRVHPGGAQTETTLDASGRPTRITSKDSAAAVAVDIGYSYMTPGTTTDRANIQTRTSHKEQGVTAGAITTYGYDALNRVILAEEKSGATVTASWSYTYDAAGNRTGQTRVGATGASAGTIGYTYNAASQLTSTTADTTTWTYDAAGNQTKHGIIGQTATYGDRQQVTKFGSASQYYFGNGNTDRVTAQSVNYVSSALGITQRISASATHNFTRTSDGELVSLRGSSPHYYTADHLGSITGMFSSTGAWEGGYSYAPYGEARFTATGSAVGANTLRYIGGLHDGSGLYKLGARYYDSSTGRFTQMDPGGQEKHAYAYAGCNPISALDPSGLATVSGGCWLAYAGVVFATGTVIVATAGSGAVFVSGLIGYGIAAGGVFTSC